ncbi:MAG: 30S ribosomal protein S6 [bacterium]
MKYYETMFIVRPTVEDEGLGGVVDRVKAFFEKHGVEINRLEEHGKKRLAYEIQKHRRGYYIQLNYYAPAPFISELKRFFVISDDIIRELTLISKDHPAVTPKESPADTEEKDKVTEKSAA